MGTRNPRVLGSSEPTPEEALRRGGAQGGSGSNPPNWIPNRGVQGEPVQSDSAVKIMTSRGVVQLERRITKFAYVDVTGGAAMSAPLQGANTAPLRRAFITQCFYGVGGRLKNHHYLTATELVVATAATAGERARCRLVGAPDMKAPPPGSSWTCAV